jgi:cobalt-zinc-cadmium resistance protein CzcA
LLRGKIAEKEPMLFHWAKERYQPALDWALGHRRAVLSSAGILLALSFALALVLGSEFAPRLSEGALAIQPARIPSTGLTASLDMQERVERSIMQGFPDEVAMVFARTGTAEVATDPMGPNISDTYVMLKPRSEWKRVDTQDELAAGIDAILADQIGQNYEFSQPIELRFNELISGVRSDIAVKVFGDDLDIMLEHAQDIARILASIKGATDIKVEQVTGLPVLTIDIDRRAISRYGLNVADVHTVVEAAFGGVTAGEVFEGDRRFDLVVRLPDPIRRDVHELERLPIPLPPDTDAHDAPASTHPMLVSDDGRERFVPLGAVAEIAVKEGPNQVSRENAKRRVVVQCNVRGRDLGGFVSEAQERIDEQVKPPPGYWLAWGGQFENLIAAQKRLAVVVPVALAFILGLLFISLGSIKNTLLIFTGVPLALTGGIAALLLRGLHFTISAAVGFIALSGVAVLNGLVMVTFIENLRREGMPLDAAVREGSLTRLRPVLMTALVAALGFVPMALASGTGAEVQRPLATVVIGGIVSSTLLTLLVLPVLYRRFHREGDVSTDEVAPSLPPPSYGPPRR